MRSYKAARRKVLKQPVEFEVEYVDERGADRVDHFVCVGEIPSLLLSELAAQSDVDSATPEGVALLQAVFLQAFGDRDEYQRFFKVATKYLDDDEVFDIMADLVEDFSGRPTVRPSGLPATPSETTASGQTSRVDSSPAAQQAAGSGEQLPELTVARVVSLSRQTVQPLAAPTPEQLAAEAELQQASSV